MRGLAGSGDDDDLADATASAPAPRSLANGWPMAGSRPQSAGKDTDDERSAVIRGRMNAALERLGARPARQRPEAPRRGRSGSRKVGTAERGWVGDAALADLRASRLDVSGT